ncbi:MAG: glycosyltransferase family 4 protein [Candidatus Magasanikbacteria bacterium]|jgi:glycosyltransferase involved in cell wall biosynthesis|nr:glycosyltransferase family 4 protein [Candidatus Magasanikbacteria bacterium]
MTIGIDARMLGKGFGLARYVEQLLIHLFAIDHTNTYVLFVQKSTVFLEVGIQLPASARIVECTIPWYSFKEQVSFSHIIKKEQVDLMHFPHWNVPLLYNDPFIVTIHDLIMYHFPRPEATTLGPAKFWLKDKVHRQVVKHAVNKAKHSIVTSEFTKHDVHTTLGVPHNRMTVTYQAPFPISSSPLPKETIHRYGIYKPYILYVGAAYPHKNIETLVDAWQQYVEEYGDTYNLVLAGKKNYFYERLLSRIGDVPSITFTDFVEDDVLDVLYREAHAFVFPSLYEGFGLPPLEAIARGIPVLASSHTCLPEVLGEAALYVDAQSTEQLVSGIHTILTDEYVRSSLMQQGREELKRYSWQRLAEETYGVYMTYGS